MFGAAKEWAIMWLAKWQSAHITVWLAEWQSAHVWSAAQPTDSRSDDRSGDVIREEIMR